VSERDPSDAARPAGPDVDADQELVMFLERDQLTAGTSVPVHRARWSRRATIALWVLRVFIILVGAMVVYTFAVNLK
jgi:hypothetical protein